VALPNLSQRINKQTFTLTLSYNVSPPSLSPTTFSFTLFSTKHNNQKGFNLFLVFSRKK
jgi:hypothetical protein